jgi:anti-anti-sigma factor
MHRFPQIDLAAALAATDIAMHIIERVGAGPAAVIKVYPLNNASDLGYSDYRERQGLTLEEYVNGQGVDRFRQLWDPLLENRTKRHTYEFSYPDSQGTMRHFETTVYQVEWAPEHAVAISVAYDVTDRREVEASQLQLQQQLQAQAAMVAELSTPLIPISDSVVVMPLIGAIDSRRAQQIMEALLQGVNQHDTQIAIIDITGVIVVDTQVANALVRAAQAVKLLGAQVVLTGIRPEVAQTLVGLGVDLQSLVTRSTLQSGISYAMAQGS